MPGYLKESFFDNWALGFDIHLDSRMSTYIANYISALTAGSTSLTVVFSNEKKTEEYGFNSLEEIKKWILETWQLDAQGIKELKEVLAEVYSIELLRQFLEHIAVIIRNSMRRLIESGKSTEMHDNVYDQISYWADGVYFTDAVLGEYVHSRREIILYVKNIEAYGSKYPKPELAFEEVFCHELFHAFHYYTAEKKDYFDVLYRSDYTKKVIMESLASYYQNKYCSKGIPTNVSSSWLIHSPVTYPYSGAAYIRKYGFTELFELSHDLDTALRELLESGGSLNIFYRIKNLIWYTEKEVSKPAKPTVVSRLALGSSNYKKEFEEYLLDMGKDGAPFKPRAAKLYLKYIERAFEEYLGLSDGELDCVNRSLKLFLVHVALWKISKIECSSLPNKEKKDITDNQSALRKLREFFEKEPFSDISEDALSGHRRRIERIALEVVAELHSGEVLSVSTIKTETEMVLGHQLTSLMVTDFTIEAIKKSTVKGDKALFDKLPTGEFKVL